MNADKMDKWDRKKHGRKEGRRSGYERKGYMKEVISR
jgi:hypothetical protein